MFVCLFGCLSVNFISVNLVQSLIVMSCIVQQTTATHCISVPLFVQFSFSPMEISVIDFSAPIEASVLKICVHL